MVFLLNSKYCIMTGVCNMSKKNNMKNIIAMAKDLFKKKPLPSGAIFVEKPSFFLVIWVYIVGVIALLLIWSVDSNIAPKVITQFVNFFKGVEYKWVEAIFSGILNIIYLLTIILIF